MKNKTKKTPEPQRTSVSIHSITFTSGVKSTHYDYHLFHWYRVPGCDECQVSKYRGRQV